MSIKQTLNNLTDKVEKITENKLAPFSYEQSAYDNDTVEGTDTYDFSKEQNIPIANADVLQVNPTILSKGFRSQVSSLPRMLLNHFFGRTSYNLNKLSDYLLSFSTSITESLGNTDGIATLDADKKLVKSQFPYQADIDIPFLNNQRKLKKEHIPQGVLLFNGFYNAQTNEPTLVNGTGVTGSAYCVSVEGRQSFGGSYTYLLKQNTFIIYNGEKWTPLAVGGSNTVGVTSVNGIEADSSGNITLTGENIKTKENAQTITESISKQSQLISNNTQTTTEHTQVIASHTQSISDNIKKIKELKDLLKFVRIDKDNNIFIGSGSLSDVPNTIDDEAVVYEFINDLVGKGFLNNTGVAVIPLENQQFHYIQNPLDFQSCLASTIKFLNTTGKNVCFFTKNNDILVDNYYAFSEGIYEDERVIKFLEHPKTLQMFNNMTLDLLIPKYYDFLGFEESYIKIPKNIYNNEDAQNLANSLAPNTPETAYKLANKNFYVNAVTYTKDYLSYLIELCTNRKCYLDLSRVKFNNDLNNNTYEKLNHAISSSNIIVKTFYAPNLSKFFDFNNNKELRELVSFPNNLNTIQHNSLFSCHKINTIPIVKDVNQLNNISNNHIFNVGNIGPVIVLVDKPANYIKKDKWYFFQIEYFNDNLCSIKRFKINDYASYIETKVEYAKLKEFILQGNSSYLVFNQNNSKALKALLKYKKPLVESKGMLIFGDTSGKSICL